MNSPSTPGPAAPFTCAQIAAQVRQHERTARAVVDDALEKADRLQERWRPFIAVTHERAREQAERIDRLIARGARPPLAGVPFAVKDLLDVEGLPTTAGSPAFAERRPAATAPAVRRLLDAGAVLIGKLNMHECAFGFTGENPHFGDCRNPWHPERVPGGSSSGSAAAVALGICPLTLGSDSGGSIRLPAAFCGTVGLKPTYGRVSRTGGIPLAWSMDHVGPLTRTAEDAALVLHVLAGSQPADDSTSRRPVPDYPAELDRAVEGLKLGVPRGWFFDSLEPEVAEAVEGALEALRELGCRTRDVELPSLPEALGAHRTIIFAEAAAWYEPHLRDRNNLFGDEIRSLLQAGLFLPAVEYLKAQRVRRRIRQEWRSVFAEVECLATPTVPLVAPPFGRQTADLPSGETPLVRACLDFSLPFNLTGHPALSVPCGFSTEGLPIGLQLVGRPFAEGTILRLAHQYQQATGWHERVPPGR